MAGFMAASGTGTGDGAFIVARKPGRAQLSAGRT
jgi:hypothetical protein